jgi:hypothetical protein
MGRKLLLTRTPQTLMPRQTRSSASRCAYPLQFACEATLNLAKQTEILALMREAQFLTVFVGRHRMHAPMRGRLTMRNLRRAFVLAFNIVLWIGLVTNYRRAFWRAAGHALRRGQIGAALGMELVAYHLVKFSREALRGEQNASFYSARARPNAPGRFHEKKAGSAA